MIVGVIGGSNLYDSWFFKSKKTSVKTEYGTVGVYCRDNVAFIPRHGSNRDKPPHMVNHRANLQALHDLGVNKVIGLCMVGSLKKTIKPSSILIPHDYFSPWSIPTYFDDKIIHINPMFDQELREYILATASRNKIKVQKKGVYVQTSGPRFETEAEIKVLSKYGDVIGMTMASEATLAQELGLGYTAICTVDNYANGISKKPLDFKEIINDAKKHSDIVIKLVEKVVEGLK